MIPLEQMGMHEIVFTWCDEQNNREVTFAISRIEQYIKDQGLEPILTNVELPSAMRMLAECGIEQHRLSRLTPEALRTPIVYAHLPDDMHLLLDGHHRYVFAAFNGFHTLPAFMLEPDQYEQFIVEGLPYMGTDKVQSGFSGIF